MSFCATCTSTLNSRIGSAFDYLCYVTEKFLSLKTGFRESKKSLFFVHNKRKNREANDLLSRIYCLDCSYSLRSSEKNYFFDSEPGIRLFVSSNLFIEIFGKENVFIIKFISWEF